MVQNYIAIYSAKLSRNTPGHKSGWIRNTSGKQAQILQEEGTPSIQKYQKVKRGFRFSHSIVFVMVIFNGEVVSEKQFAGTCYDELERNCEFLDEVFNDGRLQTMWNIHKSIWPATLHSLVWGDDDDDESSAPSYCIYSILKHVSRLSLSIYCSFKNKSKTPLLPIFGLSLIPIYQEWHLPKKYLT